MTKMTDRDQVLVGTLRDDVLRGGSGNDIIHGLAGNNVLDAGAGSDKVLGGISRDLFIHRYGENVGARDVYDGGLGQDTLRLEFSRAEWMRADVQADIVAFQAHQIACLNRLLNPLGLAKPFAFKSMGLTVSNIETLQVSVDGLELDPRDEGVSARADTLEASEDGQSLTVNLLANDAVPDLARAVIVGAAKHGTVQLTQDYSDPARPKANAVYVPDPAAFQQLAAGERAFDSFTYTVTDADGDTATATVTVTIEGHNDAPVVVGGSFVGAVIEDAASILTAKGIIAFTDLDRSDTHAVTVALKDASVAGAIAEDLIPASGFGALTTRVTDGVEGTIAWHFAVDDAAVQRLAAGQVVTQVYTLTLTDSAGVAVAQDVSITLIGTNDAPIIAGTPICDTIEDGPARTLNALAKASDVDAGTRLSVVDLPAELPPGVSYDAGTQSFRLDPSGAAYQSLAASETRTVTVNYGVSDGTATTPASVSWTVTGVNDAPVVSGAVTGSAIEDGVVVSLNALANASDVDAGTMLTVVDLPVFMPAGVSFDADTNHFTFDPSHPAYQALAQGEMLLVAIDYAVSDGTARTAARAEWTVMGTNDAPVALVDTAAVRGDRTINVAVLVNDSDIDGSAPVLSSYEGVSRLGAVVTLGPDGALTYDPTGVAAIRGLVDGQDVVDTFAYTIVDAQGAESTATVSVTVSGFNKAPVVSGPVTAAVVEGGAASVLQVLANASDPDGSTAGLSVVSLTGLRSGVTFDPQTNALRLDPSDPSFAHLKAGEVEEVIVRYGVSDGSVVTPTEAVWTVTGIDKAAIFDVDAGPLVQSREIDKLFTLNGTAHNVAPDIVRLTDLEGVQFGSAFSQQKIDLTKSFELDFSVNLGVLDWFGADGISLIFHDDPRGRTALGERGEGLGARGIINGFAIEFDTYQNGNEPANDHTGFVRTYDLSPLGGRIDLGNIEDGKTHRVVVTSNVESQTLSYTFDGKVMASIPLAQAKAFMNGASAAWFGFAGSTGQHTNEQDVKINSLTGTLIGAEATHRSFAAGEAPVSLLGAAAKLDDHGDADIASVTIVVTGGEHAGEFLGIGGTRFERDVNASARETVGNTDFAVTYDAETQTLTITGEDGPPSADDLLALLRSATYVNVQDDPIPGTRSFAITLHEEGGGVHAQAVLVGVKAGAAVSEAAQDDIITGLVVSATSAHVFEASTFLINDEAGSTIVAVGDSQRGAHVSLVDGQVVYDGTWSKAAHLLDQKQVYSSLRTMEDSFTYTVRDLDGKLSTATVMLEVGPAGGIVFSGSSIPLQKASGVVGMSDSPLTIWGSESDDRIFGNRWGDTLSGNAGNDRIFGGSGDDSISGGNGNDYIEGQAGNDVLTGGAGADTFVFSPLKGRDRITDFDVESDVIALSRSQLVDFTSVMAQATQTGAGTLISLDASTSLILNNVLKANLTAGHFDFV